jgi:hemolysin activation/secretion protein
VLRPVPTAGALPTLVLALAVAPPAAANSLADLPSGALVDPGQRLEQLERERRYYQPRERETDDDPGLQRAQPHPGGALPEDTGQSFVLRGVLFDESRFIGADRLEALTQALVGQEVSFEDINDLVDSINAIYERRGLITARAIVPPQRIDNGVLRIRLVEGRLGRLELQGRTYTSEAFLRDVVALDPGDVIDVPALRARMRAVNRLTNVQLGAQLRGGQGFGETDLVVGVGEPVRITGQVFADNNGSESTGEEQLGVYSAWNGPLRRGDALSAYVVGSQGARSASMTYALPVAATGARISATLAASRTEVIAGDFADFDITGESEQGSIEYLAPVRTWGETTLDGLARIGRVDSTSELASQPISDTRIERVALGARLRGSLGRGTWSAEQEALRARSRNLVGQRADYVRWPGRASLTGGGPWGSVLRANGSWQYSDDPQMPSSGQYQVGGVGTVRGYESGALSGERGLALALELHWGVPRGLTVFGFADYGYVDPIDLPADRIRSVGAGMQWQRGSWTVDATVAAALATLDRDQDDHRAHLRLSYGFAFGS